VTEREGGGLTPFLRPADYAIGFLFMNDIFSDISVFGVNKYEYKF
jgi:hypothetical protein